MSEAFIMVAYLLIGLYWWDRIISDVAKKASNGVLDDD